jgi:hypothetical protein
MWDESAVHYFTLLSQRLCVWNEKNPEVTFKIAFLGRIQTRDLHASTDRYTAAFGMNFEPCRIRTKRMCSGTRIPRKNVYPSAMWRKRRTIRIRLSKYKYLTPWNIAFLKKQTVTHQFPFVYVWNPKAHTLLKRVRHWSLSYNNITYFLKILFGIIFLIVPRSLKWSLSFRFCQLKFYMSSSTFPCFLYNLNISSSMIVWLQNILWRAKFLVM